MKRLNQLMLLAATLLTIGCAEETAMPSNGKNNHQKTDTKGLTAFVEDVKGEEGVANVASTRTTAEYFDKGGTNRGLHFYWTEGDRLWVNNGTLIQDASNTISDVLVNNLTTPTGVKRTPKASFSFEGTFTAPSYPVRYTGKGNLVGDKITIKAQQNQAIANDASHIGEDGDCGIATATRSAGSNQYKFTLEHKAAYLTFLPYSTINFSNSVKVTQIKVTADKAICGQFDFNDNGIDINNRPVAMPTNQSITLTLNGGNINGFPIPTSAQIASNAATMVIAPGTYNTLTVEYTLYDQTTKGGGTMTKTYNNVTLTEGKNKKISQNLQQPPQILSYGTWHPGLYTGGTTPNVHAGMWYMHRGDPHIDTLTMTVVRLHSTAPANLIRGGLWLKKKAFIPGFTPNYAHNGVNYLKHHSPLPYMYSQINGYTVNVPIGKPADVTNYFFLVSAGFNGSALYSLNGGTRYWMGNGFDSAGDAMAQVFGTDLKPNPVVEIGSNPKTIYHMYWTYQ